MKYTFEIHASMEIVPSIKELIGNLNETMASFGFEEKLDIRSHIGNYILEASREMTEAELTKAQGIIQSGLSTKFKGIRVERG